MYDELIQLEAEELSEALFGASYFDLPAGTQLFLRAKVIESLDLGIWENAYLPVAAA